MLIRALSAATLAAMIAGAAAAHDPNALPCELEDWRWRYHKTWKLLWIEGGTTCPTGHIVLRAYDHRGDNRKLIGVAEDGIEGYTFKATIMMVFEKPRAVEIEWTTIRPKPDNRPRQ